MKRSSFASESAATQSSADAGVTKPFIRWSRKWELSGNELSFIALPGLVNGPEVLLWVIARREVTEENEIIELLC